MELLRRLLAFSLLQVICRSQSPGVCSNGDVRLADGSTFLEGRVEVCVEERWGTVCDDDWGPPEAAVVCNQLGFSRTGAIAVAGPSTSPELNFGPGMGTVFLDDLQCNGQEDSLLRCDQKSNCEHDEDAGVICRKEGVFLIHQGQNVPNNSFIALEDINATIPLRCVTDIPSCCDTNRSGNWFPPSGMSPLNSAPSTASLYQSWDDNQGIILQWPSTSSLMNEGLYHCEVPDIFGNVQRLYVGVYNTPDEGTISVTDITYDSSSLTFTCISTGGPATTVTWLKNGAPISGREIPHQLTQIITDFQTASYQNQLTFTSKTEDLSGIYSCTVANSVSTNSRSMEITVCLDRSIRFNDGTTPTLEICMQDTWVTLESDFQTSSGQSIVNNLSGAALGSTGIALRWEAAATDAFVTTSYEVTCSIGDSTVTLHVSGGSEAATITRLAPSSRYQCCVVALADRSLFNLVTLRSSSECVSVLLGSSTDNTLEDASNQAGQTVTFTLGGVVGLLVIMVLVVVVGCICTMLSRKRYRQSSHRQHVTMSSEHLIDNPIYRTSGSCLRSTGENGLHSNSKRLKTVGSEVRPEINLNVLPTNSSSKLMADNPQYGSHLAPPPNEKPPRYTKVTAGPEPMYEFIHGSESNGDRSARASIHSVVSMEEVGRPGEGGGGDPVYSMPERPVKPDKANPDAGNHSSSQRNSTLPLYESTMDISITAGTDATYSKLNHN